MHLCMYVISIIMAPCNDGSVLKEQSYCACLLLRRGSRTTGGKRLDPSFLLHEFLGATM